MIRPVHDRPVAICSTTRRWSFEGLREIIEGILYRRLFYRFLGIATCTIKIVIALRVHLRSHGSRIWVLVYCHHRDVFPLQDLIFKVLVNGSLSFRVFFVVLVLQCLHIARAPLIICLNLCVVVFYSCPKPALLFNYIKATSILFVIEIFFRRYLEISLFQLFSGRFISIVFSETIVSHVPALSRLENSTGKIFGDVLNHLVVPLMIGLFQCPP
jgi:hypothetical protein